MDEAKTIWGEDMKVYVMTEAKLFGVERYVGVKKSKKEAEKCFRELCPYMRTSDSKPGMWSYLSDASKEPMLLFIHEEEL